MRKRYGPNTVHVEAFIERIDNLTIEEIELLYAAPWADVPEAARGSAWNATWVAASNARRVGACNVARDDSWNAARSALWYPPWYATWAAQALVVRDRISEEHYLALTAPVAAVLGPLHPDDEVLYD